MSNQVTLLATREVLCDQSIGYGTPYPGKNDQLRCSWVEPYLVAETLDYCSGVTELSEVLCAKTSHGSYVHLIAPSKNSPMIT